MILKMCCIHDRRADDYGAPMGFHTLGVAERSFRDTQADKNSPVGKHPEDFRLYYIGEFDTSKGKMKNVEHVLVVDGMLDDAPDHDLLKGQKAN